VYAYSDEIPHNTITPIARKKGDKFELDLVLRNNRTNEIYPDGIFHPHKELHHIKKENIGLIEVMGLAVLPARLKEELEEIKKFLLGQPNEVAPYHNDWVNLMKRNYGELSSIEEIESIVEKELGNKFARVLKDAGVFKEEADYKRFIDKLNE